MNEKELTFNYQDNLFYINEMLRRTADSLQLELDMGLYYEKIVQDIEFIHETLKKIHASLDSNSHLISRLTCLNDLAKACKTFLNLLRAINNDGLVISPFFTEFKTQLEIFIGENENSLKQITNSILEESQKALNSDHDMVSEDEYKFLFLDSQDQEPV